MSTTSIAHVSHSVTRLTVVTGSSLAQFQPRFEAAVPAAPMDEVQALVERRASWEEMVTLMGARAPHGFVLYARIPVDPLMRLAGITTPCTMYLMGNHIIAERMFRHDPEVMLHAPLRPVLWEGPDGVARLSIDRPSTLFASFGSPEIAAVGVELDRKVAALLEHLGVAVPHELLSS